jgi:RHS repeat-associated protein
VKYGYAIAPVGGYDAAGNVKNVTDSVTGTWSYTYDPLNRLQTAFSATTNSSSQYGGKYGCWAYDPFGNRTAEYYQTAPCPTPETSVPTTADKITYNTNNQVVSVNQAGPPTNLSGSFQYDQAGDVLNDGINKYLYDAEGRICAVQNLTTLAATGYVYGADGTRVAAGTLSIWPAACVAPSSSTFTLTKSYVLGLGGEQVSEINGSGAWQHTNIYAGGKLIATYNGIGAPGTYFDLNDWLGTKRAEYGASNGCLSTFFSLPYGDGLPPSPSGTCPTDATEQHFTGKERDAESGNDYFGARYFASTMGRWMSPDWSAKEDPVPYAKMDDPQSLNLYMYVRNNPLTNRDSDGHGCPGDPGCELMGAIQGIFNGDNAKESFRNALDNAKNTLGISDGKITTGGGSVDITTTVTTGNVQTTSTGDQSVSLVPGVGGTVDVTIHAPGATPGPVAVSAGTNVVSASATNSSVTVSAGYVAGPPVKAGLNGSVDTKAASSAASTAASAARGLVAPTTPPPPPAPPPPPPPPCAYSGSCSH